MPPFFSLVGMLVLVIALAFPMLRPFADWRPMAIGAVVNAVLGLLWLGRKWLP